MRHVLHFRPYTDWLGSEGRLLERIDSLLLVLFQERLAEDFVILAEMLGTEACLPMDAIRRHQNPDGLDKNLSALAVENLRRWYAADYSLFELCKDIRAKQDARRHA
jgi:hypothetical protein